MKNLLLVACGGLLLLAGFACDKNLQADAKTPAPAATAAANDNALDLLQLQQEIIEQQKAMTALQAQIKATQDQIQAVQSDRKDFQEAAQAWAKKAQESASAAEAPRDNYTYVTNLPPLNQPAQPSYVVVNNPDAGAYYPYAGYPYYGDYVAYGRGYYYPGYRGYRGYGYSGYRGYGEFRAGFSGGRGAGGGRGGFSGGRGFAGGRGGARGGGGRR
jgi:hypothetical protein